MGEFGDSDIGAMAIELAHSIKILDFQVCRDGQYGTILYDTPLIVDLLNWVD